MMLSFLKVVLIYQICNNIGYGISQKGHEHVLDRQSGIREVSIKELVIESRARREVDPSDKTITESSSSNVTTAATKSASTTPTTPPTTLSTTVFPQDCQIVTGDIQYYKYQLCTLPNVDQYFIELDEADKVSSVSDSYRTAVTSPMLLFSSGLIDHVIIQVNHMSRSRRMLAIGGKQRILRLDMTKTIRFQFPFYGQKVTNITIGVGGFLFMGPFLHRWLTTTQYVAPLMANFDTTNRSNSSIYASIREDAMVVEWRDVYTKDQPELGSFRFEAVLKKNGDIYFIYKKVPSAVTEISSIHHPVKVGLSDAYFIDTDNNGTKRRTIYEYHRVALNKTLITEGTVVLLTPLTTCNTASDCESCLTMATHFTCGWCPAIRRCSDGIDWHRQEWLQNTCFTNAINETVQCSQMTTKVTSIATNMTTNYVHVTSTPSSMTTENNSNITQKTSANTTPYTPLTTTQTGNKTTEDPIVYTQCYMDDQTYYESKLCTYSNIEQYWIELDSSDRHYTLSDAHRTAVTLNLPFQFPFFGHKIDEVSITVGGFLYISPFLHQYLTATQYIAPLMANFYTVDRMESSIYVKTQEDQLIVQWRDVYLQDQVELGPFQFEVIIKEDGQITFIYKKLPSAISAINNEIHEVKLGLSDAFYMDTVINGAKRRTIYTYSTVSVDPSLIEECTVVTFTPKQTCNLAMDCRSCLTKTTRFTCGWCEAVGRCSDGVDWYRQDWLQNNCTTNAVKEADNCPQTTTTDATVTTTDTTVTTTDATVTTTDDTVTTKDTTVRTTDATVTTTDTGAMDTTTDATVMTTRNQNTTDSTVLIKDLTSMKTHMSTTSTHKQFTDITAKQATKTTTSTAHSRNTISEIVNLHSTTDPEILISDSVQRTTTNSQKVTTGITYLTTDSVVKETTSSEKLSTTSNNVPTQVVEITTYAPTETSGKTRTTTTSAFTSTVESTLTTEAITKGTSVVLTKTTTDETTMMTDPVVETTDGVKETTIKPKASTPKTSTETRTDGTSTGSTSGTTGTTQSEISASTKLRSTLDQTVYLFLLIPVLLDVY